VAAYLALFAEDDAPLDLKPDKKNGARVDRARAALQKALRDEHVDVSIPDQDGSVNRWNNPQGLVSGGRLGACAPK
jgi:hypothetical protein